MTIKYLHIRCIDEDGKLQPAGGVTIAYTRTPTDIFLSVARCHSDYDNFCFRIGRQVAAGRLRDEGPEEILTPIVHPISNQIVEWFANCYFDEPIEVKRDSKGRWVSTFSQLSDDPNIPPEIVHQMVDSMHFSHDVGELVDGEVIARFP